MKKPPIHPLSSLRFFLIFYIVIAHFIQVATRDATLLALFKQHHIVVGAFFALSGYVMTYGYSNLGQTGARPIEFMDFFRKRLTRVYPLYFITLLAFSPLFIYVELHYGHGWMTFWHGLSVATLTQAWIPGWEMLWNSPMWFLSAIIFCSACFPLLSPLISSLRNGLLWRLLFTLWSSAIVIKLLYSVESGWVLREGAMRSPPPYFFQLCFNPLINLIEFAMGMCAARLVMMGAKTAKDYTTPLALTLVAVTVGRLYLPLNDPLSRTALFIPLFLLFTMQLHHSKGMIAKLLSQKWALYLGDISFALFVIHGPLGQLLYKKSIASHFWNTTPPLTLFLLLSLVAASLLHHGVEKPATRWLNNKSKQKQAV